MTAPAATVTVGVCTRNRPAALLRCLRSLSLAGELVREVIVVDDASCPPVRAQIEPLLGGGGPPIRWERIQSARGPAAGRNTVARLARSGWLLNLDDDAFLLDARGLATALGVASQDAAVGAVAFAQSDANGQPWPPAAQPSHARLPSTIATFTGYAHLLRRDAFLRAGGFLEPLEINGEEKDLCLRLLDAGYSVVYLPEARIGHVAAPEGRDPRRYLHQTVRNEVLSAAHALPAVLGLPLGVMRLLRYFPMRRGWGIEDPWGLGVVLRAIAARLPAVLRARRPVRWSTLRRWRALTRASVPYRAP